MHDEQRMRSSRSCLQGYHTSDAQALQVLKLSPQWKVSRAAENFTHRRQEVVLQEPQLLVTRLAQARQSLLSSPSHECATHRLHIVASQSLHAWPTHASHAGSGQRSHRKRTGLFADRAQLKTRDPPSDGAKHASRRRCDTTSRTRVALQPRNSRAHPSKKPGGGSHGDRTTTKPSRASSWTLAGARCARLLLGNGIETYAERLVCRFASRACFRVNMLRASNANGKTLKKQC